MRRKYKFVHLADTHVRNRKYHKEYKIIFDELYKKIKDEKPDYIIHSGDIFHLKTVLSPESVLMVSDFYRNLSKIAPTYAILGNHDTNLKNKQRLDAISPIVENINSKNLLFSRDTVVWEVNEDIRLHMWSLLDPKMWDKPKDQEKINICVYHGAVQGSKTDVDHELIHVDLMLKDFDGFDYVMLGDIHRSDQALDPNGRIRYAGSTIQQNFGEKDDKGYLVWEIESKDEFETRHVSIPHPKPFVSIYLDENDKFDEDLVIKKGSKVRIVPYNNLSIDKSRYIQDFVQSRYNPEYVLMKNNSSKRREDKVLSNELMNLRDIKNQEKYIEEYLKEYNPSKETLSRVFDINKEYDSICNKKDDELRNVSWEIEELSWNNYYNYGEDNLIDFTKLEGTVGIFGKNFSGKSSIVDTLLLTLFNSDSKSSRKNVYYINENKDQANSSAKIKIGGSTLYIDRQYDKVVRNVGKKQSEDASVNVTFKIVDDRTGEVTYNTKDKRSQTDQEIQKYIGSLENFLLSSMSAQNSALKFLDQKNTKRKEIIAKFLDLELFEKKYLTAKDTHKELKGQLKLLENRNFNIEISNIEKEQQKNEKDIIQFEKNCNKLREKIAETKAEIKSIENITKKDKLLDIDQVRSRIERIQKEQNRLEKELLQAEKSIVEKEALLKKYDNILEQNKDIQACKDEQEGIVEKIKLYEKSLLELKQQKGKIKESEKKIGLLSEVPCGGEYSGCKFIKDAHVASQNLEILRENLQYIEEKINNIDNDKISIRKKELSKYIEEYDKNLRSKEKLSNEISRIQIQLERTKLQIDKNSNELIELKQQEKEYEQNKQIYDNLSANKTLLKNKKSFYKELNGELVNCEAKQINLYTKKGELGNKLENIQYEKEKFERLLFDYTSFDLFLKAMHSNGIPYYIIKQNLPIINDEVAKILDKVVDFEVFLETEVNKLNVYIKHPKYKARPIEGGSGAEKSFAAIALRLALLNISSLPTSQIFILDEPGTAYDEANLEGFTRILDLIKEQFKTVFIISHMDSIKDVTDSILEIEKIDGFAKIRN